MSFDTLMIALLVALWTCPWAVVCQDLTTTTPSSYTQFEEAGFNFNVFDPLEFVTSLPASDLIVTVEQCKGACDAYNCSMFCQEQFSPSWFQSTCVDYCSSLPFDGCISVQLLPTPVEGVFSCFLGVANLLRGSYGPYMLTSPRLPIWPDDYNQIGTTHTVYIRDIEIPPHTPVPAPWLTFKDTYSAPIFHAEINPAYRLRINSAQTIEQCKLQCTLYNCTARCTTASCRNTCKVRQSQECEMIFVYIWLNGPISQNRLTNSFICYLGVDIGNGMPRWDPEEPQTTGIFFNSDVSSLFIDNWMYESLEDIQIEDVSKIMFLRQMRTTTTPAPTPALTPAPTTSSSNKICSGLCRAPAGYAVTASGSNLEPCPANQYNNGSAKACTACPWPQTFTAGTGLTGVAQCACRPGYERVGGVGGVCTACALGSFKNASGDAACAACSSLLGPYSTTLQPASANASACVCWPGYERVGGACQLTACAAGSAVKLAQSSASCQCAPGFGFVGTLPDASALCAACGDGLFKDFIGNAACISCGANTVSLAPRANRSACACAADFEPGQDDGPDVPGGSCVAQCDAGYEGARGVCALCATGKFKASKGQACSACPGARSASPRGNTQASKCSCPRSTVEIAAADMARVERLGPFLDDSAESLAGLGALLLAANASRPLWRLEIVFPPGAREARVTVGGRLVFACARGSCRDTVLELQGMRGALNASAPAAALTLRWRTRRQLVFADAASAAAWLPAAAARAQAWAAAGRLRPGAAVFRARNVFSSSVAACAPCPAGLRCAAYVGAGFGA